MSSTEEDVVIVEESHEHHEHLVRRIKCDAIVLKPRLHELADQSILF